MKELSLYWIIGCIVIGTMVAVHQDRCPNDPMPKAGDALASVAVWPAYVAAAIAMKSQALSQCERTP